MVEAAKGFTGLNKCPLHSLKAKHEEKKNPWRLMNEDLRDLLKTMKKGKNNLVSQAQK